jgi:hypothetical protein
MHCHRSASFTPPRRQCSGVQHAVWLPARETVPSAVLSKVLQHDIIRLTKTTAAYIKNNAIGCYDQLVNNVVLLMLRKMGLPDSVALCLSQLWDLHVVYSSGYYASY